MGEGPDGSRPPSSNFSSTRLPLTHNAFGGRHRRTARVSNEPGRRSHAPVAEANTEGQRCRRPSPNKDCSHKDHGALSEGTKAEGRRLHCLVASCGALALGPRWRWPIHAPPNRHTPPPFQMDQKSPERATPWTTSSISESLHEQQRRRSTAGRVACSCSVLQRSLKGSPAPWGSWRGMFGTRARFGKGGEGSVVFADVQPFTTGVGGSQMLI